MTHLLQKMDMIMEEIGKLNERMASSPATRIEGKMDEIILNNFIFKRSSRVNA